MYFKNGLKNVICAQEFLDSSIPPLFSQACSFCHFNNAIVVNNPFLIFD